MSNCSLFHDVVLLCKRVWYIYTCTCSCIICTICVLYCEVYIHVHVSAKTWCNYNQYTPYPILSLAYMYMSCMYMYLHVYKDLGGVNSVLCTMSGAFLAIWARGQFFPLELALPPWNCRWCADLCTCECASILPKSLANWFALPDTFVFKKFLHCSLRCAYVHVRTCIYTYRQIYTSWRYAVIDFAYSRWIYT